VPHGTAAPGATKHSHSSRGSVPHSAAPPLSSEMVSQHEPTSLYGWSVPLQGNSSRWLPSPAKVIDPPSYAGCASDTHGKKFLMLSSCAEQSNKGIGAVADAAFYAKSLGRVFVEPAVQGSRVVSPFTQTNAEWDGLSLAHHWDIGPLCQFTPMLPLRRFLWLTQGSGSTEKWAWVDMGMGPLPPNVTRRLGGGATSLDVQRYFAQYASARVIVLKKMWKRSAGIANLGHNIPELFASAAIARAAHRVACRVGGQFACVQWRSEGANAGNLAECANDIARSATNRLMSAQLNGRPLVLLTDLFPGNSDTLRRHGSQQAALEVLEKALPPINELLSNFAGVTNSGMRAMLELELCARAKVVVSCADHQVLTGFNVTLPSRSVCARCVKMNSGFTYNLLRTRAALVNGGSAAGSECALDMQPSSTHAWRM